eukprot:4776283-Pleurochrysis_carterae.AAC.1
MSHIGSPPTHLPDSTTRLEFGPFSSPDRRAAPQASIMDGRRGQWAGELRASAPSTLSSKKRTLRARARVGEAACSPRARGRDCPVDGSAWLNAALRALRSRVVAGNRVSNAGMDWRAGGDKRSTTNDHSKVEIQDQREQKERCVFRAPWEGAALGPPHARGRPTALENKNSSQKPQAGLPHPCTCT